MKSVHLCTTPNMLFGVSCCHSAGFVPASMLSLPNATDPMLLHCPPEQVMAKITNSVKLSDVRAADFDAVYLPGGHGTCFDLPGDEVGGQL